MANLFMCLFLKSIHQNTLIIQTHKSICREWGEKRINIWTHISCHSFHSLISMWSWRQFLLFFFFFSFSSLVCLYDLAPKRECIVEYVLLFFYTSIMSVRLFFVIVVCHCRLVQYVCESTKWNWLLEEWLLKWILLHALSI